MTNQEILDLARSWLEDTLEPYKWSTSELIHCYNAAIEKFYRRVYPFQTDSASFCTIDVPCNTYELVMDYRIIDVEHAWLNTEETWLTKKTSKWLDTYNPMWRNDDGTPVVYVPDPESLKMWIWPKYDADNEITGAANISFTTGPNVITYAAGGLDEIYAAGDRIQVTGTTSNNATVTVTVAAHTTLTVSQTLIAEPNTSAILRKIEDSIKMSVYRLPLTEVSLANLTSSPEVRSMWHRGFVHGILAEAYTKQDTETYDPESHQKALDAFEDVIQGAMLSTIDSRQDGQVCHAHYGMI